MHTRTHTIHLRPFDYSDFDRPIRLMRIILSAGWFAEQFSININRRSKYPKIARKVESRKKG